MLAVVLALGASAGWGTADFLAGTATRRLSVLVVALISQSAGLVLMAVLVAAAPHVPTAHVLVLGAAAGVLGIVGLLALYAGLAIGPMGVVAPLAALSGLVPVAVGLAQGERPAAIQAVGIVLAIGGVVLASRHRDEHGGRASPKAIGLAALAAVALGSLVVMLRDAGRVEATWAVLMVRVSSLALLGVLVLARRPAFSGARPLLATLVVVGVLDAGANLLFVLASQRGLLSLVAVLASLYPVATVILARGVLKERLSGVQLAGVAAALAGVALIAAG